MRHERKEVMGSMLTDIPMGNCSALCASSLYLPRIDAAPSGEITPKYPPDNIYET